MEVKGMGSKRVVGGREARLIRRLARPHRTAWAGELPCQNLTMRDIHFQTSKYGLHSVTH